MKLNKNECIPDGKSVKVAITFATTSFPSGWAPCVVGKNIDVKSDDLERYCSSDWDPLVRDLLLLAAAVEFCDRLIVRPQNSWGRKFRLRVPIETESLFSKPASDALHSALELLTGDSWRVEFINRPAGERSDKQRNFQLEDGNAVIMPFSEGLDSLMVAKLWEKEGNLPTTLVRLGGKLHHSGKQPFVSVPYEVHTGKSNQESSGRSRGFKFAILCGIAAYLKNSSRIVVSESGQGALAPVLISVGQIHPDYRNHPLFMSKMSDFFRLVMDRSIHFEWPRLWSTKGETLRDFIKCGGANWQSTRSCWRGNQWVPVDGKRRQCGVCAACLLRRLSVHAANCQEPSSNYAIERITERNLAQGAASGFDKITEAMWQYAVAGVLHLEHLASYRKSFLNQAGYKFRIHELSTATAIPASEVQVKMDRFLGQHEKEWNNFVESLGPKSYVNQILSGAA